jgi:hypothetical protein
MRHHNRLMTLVAAALLCGAPALMAQTPANDPSARLTQVLPVGVANQVLVVIARARSHDLPAQALANRALKFAAKGVDPSAIAKAVSEQESRMELAHSALQTARGTKPSDDEVDAGAEAMRKGVTGADVSALAKAAPSGRSLAVPLYVIGSLIDRGLASGTALQRVEDRLTAHASDGELQQMPSQLPAQAIAGRDHQPTDVGRDLAQTKRPGSAAGAGQSGAAGGPPSGVPANGGASAKPTTPPGLINKPSTPKKP